MTNDEIAEDIHDNALGTLDGAAAVAAGGVASRGVASASGVP